MALRVCGRSQHNMCLLEILFTAQTYPGVGHGRGPVLQPRPGGTVAEFFRDQVHHFAVLQVSRRGNQHVVGSIVTAKISEQMFAVKVTDCLPRPENRTAQGVTSPVSLREDLMHQVVRGVFHHLDFFPDYLRFLGDVVGPEERVYDEVRQHFESARQVLIENLG